MDNINNNYQNYATVSNQMVLQLTHAAEKAFSEAKYSLSILYYTQVIEQLQSSSNIAYALYKRGCAYKKKGNISKAHEDWGKALSFGFEHPLDIIN